VAPGRYIALVEGDYERIPQGDRKRVTVPDVVIPGVLALYDMRARKRKIRGGPLAGRSECGCAAFKGSPMTDGCGCSIYKSRPETCREYVAGGEQCLEVRDRFLTPPE
jgi:Fe-S-cluster containining protein